MVDQSMFEKLDIQILAISADTPFSQEMFAASMELSYPMLSDHPDLKTIQQFEVLKRIGKAKRPIAQGAYFLIDKEGTIRGKWMGNRGEVFPSETLLKAARENLN
jgi:peroxiredoxin